MGKLKLFASNMIVYGAGGIIGKVIPLIMVPIVTRLMPNSSYYGISDMSNSILSFCSALAVMGMYDAMYRMFFERDKNDFAYKKEVCSTTLTFTLMTSLVVFAIMLLMKDYLAQWFFEDRQYSYIIYITATATLIGATNSIVSAPTRMQNKRGVYLITNTVSPLISYGISIPLLLAGHYLIALPLAGAISALTMEATFMILNRKWFSFKRVNWKLLKQLLVIAVPLLPNFIIYWIFDSSDRLMITNMIGLEATGVYAVSAKLGHVSQLIYTAFAGGWQYFAFSVMRERDQVKTNSLIFEYMGALSFVCAAFAFALSEPLFHLLFEEEYWEGFIAAPYLFFAPLLLMLFQIEANQFLVIKKTWPNLLVLALGAGLNILLNYFLIPVLGIEGAAIGTLVGYIVSVLICTVVLCSMKLMKASPRFILATLLVIGYILLWRFVMIEIVWVSAISACVFAIVIVLLYLKDLKNLFEMLKHALARRKITEGAVSSEHSEKNEQENEDDAVKSAKNADAPELIISENATVEIQESSECESAASETKKDESSKQG